MNSLFVLLTIQILVSILLIVWVRIKVMRSLDDGDSVARVRREIGALIVELDGSADRNITLIEDRLRELKDCIAEADKKIVMLSNERSRTWVSPPVPLQRAPQDILHASQDQFHALRPIAPASQPATPASQAPVPAVPQPVPNPQLPFQSTRQEAGGQASRQTPSNEKERSAARDSSLYGSVQTSAVPFIRFSEKPLVFEEPFAERVARLYKRGFSSDIIAAKLKATISEVDLAIAAGFNPPEGRGEG
jgi:hypothetical protein